MNTRRVNAAADVIARAMESGYVTPAGWASALESAQLLQSPEKAAEFEELLAQVAALQGAEEQSKGDAARARRERDLIRERVSEPFGCAHCGEVKRVHGRRYISGVGTHTWERPSDEQVKGRMLARRAARAPMPVGAEPRTLDVVEDELTGTRLSLYEEELETARLRLALKSAQRGRRKLRARVAELEAQRDRRRARLVALQNDALNVRGALSPSGEARKVPMPLGETLLPAVEWLINRVAELEVERHSTNEALDDAVQELRARRDEAAVYASRPLPDAGVRCSCGHGGGEHHHAGTACYAHLPRELGQPVRICPCKGFRPVSAAASSARLTRYLAPEGEHYAAVHHDYRVSHDLPPLGGAE